MFSAIVNKLAVALLLLVVATLTVCAAEIGKISIVQDSGQLSEEMIRFNIQLKVGDTFDENILNADIKRLHGTGFFADIVSETKDAGSGKVDITIRTKAKPTIKNVYIVGNIKYPSYELMKNVSLSAEQPLNDNQLRESANKLRSFYKEKGAPSKAAENDTISQINLQPKTDDSDIIAETSNGHLVVFGDADFARHKKESGNYDNTQFFVTPKCQNIKYQFDGKNQYKKISR